MSAMSTLDEVKSWLDEQLPALIEKYDVPGAAVAVLAGGEVVDDAAGVLSKATGVEATADSVFQIGSITKVWTSTLVMQLVDEGKVDLDAPVRTYLPEFKIADEDGGRADHHPPAAQPHVRLRGRHLHRHRRRRRLRREVRRRAARGAPAVPGRASSSPTTTPATACSAGWSRCSARSRTTTACASTSSRRSASPTPRPARTTRSSSGRRWATSSSSPAPASSPPRSGRWLAPTRPPARCCRCARATCSRSPRCTSSDGKAADGTQVLAPGTAGRMHDREVDLPYLGVMGDSWGLGFERFDTADGAIIGHDGSTIGQNAFLRMIPEAGVAVALLTNGGDVLSLYHDIAGHVLAELAGVTLPPLPTPPAVAGARSTPSRYVGTYSAEVADLVVSQDEDGRIWLEQTPKGLFEELGEKPERRELVHFRGDSLINVEPEQGMHIPHAFVGDDGDGHALYLHIGRAVRRAGA